MWKQFAAVCAAALIAAAITGFPEAGTPSPALQAAKTASQCVERHWPLNTGCGSDARKIRVIGFDASSRS